MNQQYMRTSNALKLAFIICGGVIGLIQYSLTDSFAPAVLVSTSFVAISLILITLIDKSHTETFDELSTIRVMIQENFDYQGILDSPKREFTASEMRDLWPVLMLRVKHEFLAVNYLSQDVWERSGGDSLVTLLGLRSEIERLNARRLFVVDGQKELKSWHQSAQLHCKHHILVRWITKERFDSIRDELCEDISAMASATGFNILDPSTKGIVVDWKFEGRQPVGAVLRIGDSVARQYSKLFNRAWSRAEEFKGMGTGEVDG